MSKLSVMNRLHVDVIRAFLDAKSAVVAEIVVFSDMKDLELRLCVEYFENISQDAESSKQDSPRYVCTDDSCNVICTEKDSDPYPELQCVGNRSERTDIPAPEHIYH